MEKFIEYIKRLGFGFPDKSDQQNYILSCLLVLALISTIFIIVVNLLISYPFLFLLAVIIYILHKKKHI